MQKNLFIRYCATVIFAISVFTLLTITAPPAEAHFGMVIPDKPRITQDNKSSTLSISFSHPFENRGMDLVKPEKFSVTVNGKTTDLTDTLTSEIVMDHEGWKTDYRFARPGVYQFVMEPTPYWEPTEDVSIIHYTKTVIPAYGADENWDQPVGLPAEIVPLLRPFGNYAGNSFTGKVLMGGNPVGGAEVEVEFYNPGARQTAPSDYHITQMVKADERGIFRFTCPWPGWWGFAALTEAPYTIKDPEGNEKSVELGAIFWTFFDQHRSTGN
jgi:cobalt/nickel transport protein